jgi:hypothetical protein
MRQILGPANAHARAAVARLQQMSSATALHEGADAGQALPGLLEAFYPQRFQALGRPAVVAMVQLAVERAAALQLLTTRGAVLCAVLMYELGHRCFDDPLQPWLSRAVLPQPGDTDERRTKRLEAKSGAYLALVARRLERAGAA